jgi:hypothetical protein
MSLIKLLDWLHNRDVEKIARIEQVVFPIPVLDSQAIIVGRITPGSQFPFPSLCRFTLRGDEDKMRKDRSCQRNGI